MRCPACGAEVAATDSFCGHCGQALTIPSEGAGEEGQSANRGSHCLVCGTPLSRYQGACSRCKTPRGYRVDPTAPVPVRYVSASGQSVGGTTAFDADDVPAEIKGGWNWGGCTMGCLWAFAMNLPLWGLLAALGSFCGPIGLGIAIVLGLKGNEWAWKNRRFESVEHFQRVQRVWAIVGITLTIVFFLAYAGIVLLSMFLQ